MDKSTLSNYGWVVCVILVLAIMISLATPFGSVIRDRVAGTVTNFRDNANGVLDNMGGATSFDDLGGGGSGGAGGNGGSGGGAGEEEGGEEEEETLAPGLYETGTDTLVYTWDELLANDVIDVTDGVLTVAYSENEDGENENIYLLAGDLVIPDTATEIGDYAFSGCWNLTSVTIPNSVNTIGECAFECCESIEELYIPSGVTDIKAYAFSGCWNLSVEVDANNPVYCSVDGDVFSKDQKMIVAIMPDGRTSYTIPSGVTAIGVTAFGHGSCELTDIYFSGTRAEWDALPKGDDWDSCMGCVSDDGSYVVHCSDDNGSEASNAGGLYDEYYRGSGERIMTWEELIDEGFVEVSGTTLTYVSVGAGGLVIPEGITKIGDGAFTECYDLYGISIPSTVTEFGYNAFTDCLNVHEIDFAGSVDDWNSITKRAHWNADMISELDGEDLYVYCSDGTVTESEPYESDYVE